MALAAESGPEAAFPERLHGYFLLLSARDSSNPDLLGHINVCIDASITTFDTLYDSYLQRPSFSLWWSIVIYLLYASRVVLCIVAFFIGASLLSMLVNMPETLYLGKHSSIVSLGEYGKISHISKVEEIPQLCADHNAAVIRSPLLAAIAGSLPSGRGPLLKPVIGVPSAGPWY